MEANGINKKYRIKIEVLTPLSIGRGSDYDYELGVHYVEKDGVAYILDMRWMIESGIDVNRITTCMSTRDNDQMLQVIGDRLDAVSTTSFPLPISSSNPLKVMIRNELTGCPIIPGSSLKGAISSHILHDRIEEIYSDRIDSLKRMNRINSTDFFGDFSLGQSLLRFIKVSDVEFDKDATRFVNTKVFNLIRQGNSWIGGWKHGNNSSTRFSPTGFNTLYESLMPGATAEGCIMTSEQMFDVMLKAQPSMKKATLKTDMREYLDIEYLFRMINDYTYNHLGKEWTFFNTYHQADRNDDIMDSVEALQDMIPKDGKSCILQMSAGSGFHSITGDWQFEDYTDDDGVPLDRKRTKNRDAKPKSRKIALWDGNMSPMGFVRLTLV